eukprot:tig00021365_g20821.t1
MGRAGSAVTSRPAAKLARPDPERLELAAALFLSLAFLVALSSLPGAALARGATLSYLGNLTVTALPNPPGAPGVRPENRYAAGGALSYNLTELRAGGTPRVGFFTVGGLQAPESVVREYRLSDPSPANALKWSATSVGASTTLFGWGVVSVTTGEEDALPPPSPSKKNPPNPRLALPPPPAPACLARPSTQTPLPSPPLPSNLYTTARPPRSAFADSPCSAGTVYFIGGADDIGGAQNGNDYRNPRNRLTRFRISAPGPDARQNAAVYDRRRQHIVVLAGTPCYADNRQYGLETLVDPLSFVYNGCNDILYYSVESNAWTRAVDHDPSHPFLNGKGLRSPVAAIYGDRVFLHGGFLGDFATLGHVSAQVAFADLGDLAAGWRQVSVAGPQKRGVVASFVCGRFFFSIGAPPPASVLPAGSWGISATDIGYNETGYSDAAFLDLSSLSNDGGTYSLAPWGRLPIAGDPADLFILERAYATDSREPRGFSGWAPLPVELYGKCGILAYSNQDVILKVATITLETPSGSGSGSFGWGALDATSTVACQTVQVYRMANCTFAPRSAGAAISYPAQSVRLAYEVHPTGLNATRRRNVIWGENSISQAIPFQFWTGSSVGTARFFLDGASLASVPIVANPAPGPNGTAVQGMLTFHTLPTDSGPNLPWRRGGAGAALYYNRSAAGGSDEPRLGVYVVGGSQQIPSLPSHLLQSDPLIYEYRIPDPAAPTSDPGPGWQAPYTGQAAAFGFATTGVSAVDDEGTVYFVGGSTMHSSTPNNWLGRVRNGNLTMLPTMPRISFFHTALYDKKRKWILVAAGAVCYDGNPMYAPGYVDPAYEDQNFNTCNDIMRFDVTSNAWDVPYPHNPSGRMPPRRNALGALYNDRFYIFSGYRRDLPWTDLALADLYFAELSDLAAGWRKVAISGPQKRGVDGVAFMCRSFFVVVQSPNPAGASPGEIGLGESPWRHAVYLDLDTVRPNANASVDGNYTVNGWGRIPLVPHDAAPVWQTAHCAAAAPLPDLDDRCGFFAFAHFIYSYMVPVPINVLAVYMGEIEPSDLPYTKLDGTSVVACPANAIAPGGSLTCTFIPRRLGVSTFFAEGRANLSLAVDGGVPISGSSSGRRLAAASCGYVPPIVSSTQASLSPSQAITSSFNFTYVAGTTPGCVRIYINGELIPESNGGLIAVGNQSFTCTLPPPCGTPTPSPSPFASPSTSPSPSPVPPAAPTPLPPGPTVPPKDPTQPAPVNDTLSESGVTPTPPANASNASKPAQPIEIAIQRVVIARESVVVRIVAAAAASNGSPGGPPSSGLPQAMLAGSTQTLALLVSGLPDLSAVAALHTPSSPAFRVDGVFLLARASARTPVATVPVRSEVGRSLPRNGALAVSFDVPRGLPADAYYLELQLMGRSDAVEVVRIQASAATAALATPTPAPRLTPTPTSNSNATQRAIPSASPSPSPIFNPQQRRRRSLRGLRQSGSTPSTPSWLEIASDRAGPFRVAGPGEDTARNVGAAITTVTAVTIAASLAAAAAGAGSGQGAIQALNTYSGYLGGSGTAYSNMSAGVQWALGYFPTPWGQGPMNRGASNGGGLRFRRLLLGARDIVASQNADFAVAHFQESLFYTAIFLIAAALLQTLGAWAFFGRSKKPRVLVFPRLQVIFLYIFFEGFCIAAVATATLADGMWSVVAAILFFAFGGFAVIGTGFVLVVFLYRRGLVGYKVDPEPEPSWDDRLYAAALKRGRYEESVVGRPAGARGDVALYGGGSKAGAGVGPAAGAKYAAPTEVRLDFSGGAAALDSPRRLAKLKPAGAEGPDALSADAVTVERRFSISRGRLALVYLEAAWRWLYYEAGWEKGWGDGEWVANVADGYEGHDRRFFLSRFRFRHAFGILFSCYRFNAASWLFGFWDVVKKVLVALVVSLMVTDDNGSSLATGQTALALLFIVVEQIWVVFGRPFRSRYDNIMTFILNILQFIVVVLVRVSGAMELEEPPHPRATQVVEAALALNLVATALLALDQIVALVPVLQALVSGAKERLAGRPRGASAADWPVQDGSPARQSARAIQLSPPAPSPAAGPAAGPASPPSASQRPGPSWSPLAPGVRGPSGGASAPVPWGPAPFPGANLSPQPSFVASVTNNDVSDRGIESSLQTFYF